MKKEAIISCFFFDCFIRISMETRYVTQQEKAILRKDYDALISSVKENNFDRMVKLLQELSENFRLKNFRTDLFDQVLANVDTFDAIYSQQMYRLVHDAPQPAQAVIQALQRIDETHYYHYWDPDQQVIDDQQLAQVVQASVIEPLFEQLLTYGINLQTVTYDAETPFTFSQD